MKFRVTTTLFVLMMAVSNAAFALTITRQPGATPNNDSATYFVYPTNACPIHFEVAAVGIGELSYQWQRGSMIVGGICAGFTPIPGATGASLDILSGNQPETFCLQVAVTDQVETVLSRDIRVNFTNSTSIAFSRQPITDSWETVFPTGGSAVTLRSQACGPGPVSYQWYRYPHGAPNQETLLPGETNRDLSFVTDSAPSDMEYRVRASGSSGTVTSNSFRITATDLPVIRIHPDYSQISGSVGATVQVPIQVIGSGVSAVRAYYIRPALSGPYDPSVRVDLDNCSISNCSIPLLVPLADRTIVIEAQNSHGLSSVQGPRVTIVGAPAAQVEPEIFGVLDENGQPTAVQLRAFYAGSAPATYRWQRNGVDLTAPGTGGFLNGATTPPYGLVLQAGIFATLDDIGARYSVRIWNSSGSSVSNEATLQLSQPPAILQPPFSSTVQVGQLAQFSVVASGSALRYQWYRNDAAIEGATQSLYQFRTTAVGNGGVFHVVVSNQLGSVLSEQATLVVTNGPAGGPGDPACRNNLDDDGDGLIDFPNDPGCSSADDEAETMEPGPIVPECRDGLDNDRDGLVDLFDADCLNPDDDLEASVSVPPGCSIYTLSDFHARFGQLANSYDRFLASRFNAALSAARRRGGNAFIKAKRAKNAALKQSKSLTSKLLSISGQFAEREQLCSNDSGCLNSDRSAEIVGLQSTLTELQTTSASALQRAFRIAKAKKSKLDKQIGLVNSRVTLFTTTIAELPLVTSSCGS